MRIISLAAVNVALFGLSGTALAQDASDDSGFYIAGNVGIATLSDPTVTYYDVGGTFDGTGTTDTADAALATKNATTFGGAIGYDFGTVRADIELQYGRHTVESLTFVSVNGTPVVLSATDRIEVCDYLEADTCGGTGNTFIFDGSRARQLSALGNVWLDIPAGGGFTPYVGGGLGITGFEVDGEGTGKFTWQLGAGASVKLARGVAMTLDYRHRSVGAANIAYDASSGFNVSKLSTDSFTAGLRFTF